jgi:hypothetical protein
MLCRRLNLCCGVRALQWTILIAEVKACVFGVAQPMRQNDIIQITQERNCRLNINCLEF